MGNRWHVFLQTMYKWREKAVREPLDPDKWFVTPEMATSTLPMIRQQESAPGNELGLSIFIILDALLAVLKHGLIHASGVGNIP